MKTRFQKAAVTAAAVAVPLLCASACHPKPPNNELVISDSQGRVLAATPVDSPPEIREPVLPEMLVACRGHVLVPALGMTLVLKGKEPPPKGEYLREDRLTPPYRILPPNARVSAEQSPTRLNIEVDKFYRIIGLYCG